MNSREIHLQRKKVRDWYKVPGQHNYQKRPINAVYFRSGSIKHEMSKAIGGLMLNRFGVVFTTSKIISLLTNLEDEINRTGKLITESPKWFITEAQERVTFFGHKPGSKTPVRDLVCLDNGEVYEFELTEKRASRHQEDIIVFRMFHEESKHEPTKKTNLERSPESKW